MDQVYRRYELDKGIAGSPLKKPCWMSGPIHPPGMNPLIPNTTTRRLG